MLSIENRHTPDSAVSNGMRIVLATPLYPPEIADAAAYVKELARRLAKDHKVTIVTYAHLPEPLPGVTVSAIEKRRPLLSRLFSFRNALARALRDADAVLAINGASVELPLLLVSRRQSVPLIFCTADHAAHERAGLLERLASSRADRIVSDFPPHRPEILPFAPRPVDELASYEQSWDTHLAELSRLFHHAD